jgi:hypothetical protein
MCGLSVQAYHPSPQGPTTRDPDADYEVGFAITQWLSGGIALAPEPGEGVQDDETHWQSAESLVHGSLGVVDDIARGHVGNKARHQEASSA